MAVFLRLSPRPRRAARLMALVAAAAATGCQNPPPPARAEGVVPTYNASTGRLERISYDRDKDGTPDAWLFMEGTRATRAELDENHDGAVDRWEHFAEAAIPGTPGGAMPQGTLVRAEQSTRFDGKVTRWETYTDGRLAKVEEDTTGDGRADKWETWTNGSLVEVALDTKDTGKPDRRIVYPPDGAAPRMLVDEKGDGTFRPVGGS